MVGPVAPIPGPEGSHSASAEAAPFSSASSLWGKFNSGRSKRFFPRQEATGQRDRPTKPESPFQETVSTEDILYLVRRDELAYRTIMRWSGAVFNKWMVYKSDNEARQKRVRELYDKLEVKKIFKRAYMLSRVHGYALVALGFVESMPNELLPPQNVQDIDYIHAIPRTAIQEIKQALDPTKENYGEIENYVIKRPKGTSTEEVTIPAARFQHWRNDFIDDDPKGISLFEPLFDKFTVKKNLDYALGEVPYSMAKPFPTLLMPTDADDEEIIAVDAEMKQLSVKSHFILPNDYDLKFKGPEGTLNPKPYSDYMLTTLAAGSLGSKVALLGTEAGAVTGSEVNIDEWYLTVSDEQTNVVEPKLRDFNRILTEFQIIPEGNDTFEWAPLKELDDQAEADIESKRGQALLSTASAIQILNSIGFKVKVDDDGLVFTSPDGEEMALGALNSMVQVRKPAKAPGTTTPSVVKSRARPQKQRQTPKPAPAASSSMGTRRPLLPDHIHKQMYQKWMEKTNDIENRFGDQYQTIVTLMQNDFMGALKAAWVKVIGPVEVDPGKGATPAASARPDPTAIYDMLSEWMPKGFETYRAAFFKFLDQAYEAGAEQTLGLMDLDPTVFRLEDSNAIKFIRVAGDRIARDTYLENHKGAMTEIMEGLKNGESYAQINDRIAGKFGEFSDGIPNTVQKVVHEAASEARWETMQKHGADRGVFSTARDDVVRPEHRALEGLVMTRDESMPYLADWGCRCTTIPLTVYDEYVAQAEGGEGA